MNIFDQLDSWKRNQVFIELRYIDNRQSRTVFGRIYSFDLSGQNILFYNEDLKRIENISLNQIEDAIPSSTNPAPADPDVSSSPAENQTEEPASKERELRAEMISIAERLALEDLNALLPLMKRLLKPSGSRGTTP